MIKNWIIGLLLVVLTGACFFNYNKHAPVVVNVLEKPFTANVDLPVDYLGYVDTEKLAKQWCNSFAPITEFSVYGKSANGNDLFYVRTTGDKSKNLNKVLIMACIHGNEKIATATVTGILGKMLNSYNKDPKITELVNNNDIYWILVVSPDSYIMDQRWVENRDPNRDFIARNPVTPVKAIMDLQDKMHFTSMISTHAYGSYLLYPWGESFLPTKDDNKFRSVLLEMSKFNGYKVVQCRKVPTALPYRGFEIDWFYRQGTFSTVVEIGHEFKPNKLQIPVEVNKNFDSYMYFIRNAKF